ncbi:MAG TPA: tRNA(Ile2) 2-agmatinylcytidine synthetase, partial [Candidatus Thermoplasmatota archaeon]|nr:tRNA(Ile2) 2-agmatinylcytidine synthetase [Candidatus Thermoplasmatota archaeon]
RDEHGALRCAAYAPTRSFRRRLAALAPGDDVTVCGGVHDGPDGLPTLGVEKMLVHATTPRRLGNPLCPSCGRAMKSAGRGAGWRCCGHRAAAPRAGASGLEGWHEVPASARRHLAMPLRRMRQPGGQM